MIFTTVIVRHERRLRLFFSVNIGGAASNPALFAVTAQNASVPVGVAALAVPGTPNAIDLAFDRDLSQGAVYAVAALGVPGVDGSSTSNVPDATNTLAFGLGTDPTPPNVENPDDDLGALVYGTDIVFDGTDYVLLDNGDLATVSGIANYQGAMTRRVAQDAPLPWATLYGGRPGEYVNGPSPLAGTLQGAVLRQAYADDRTKQASVGFAADPTDPSSMVYQLTLVPKGAADGAIPIAIAVPT